MKEYIKPLYSIYEIEQQAILTTSSFNPAHTPGEGWGHHKDDPGFPGKGHKNSLDIPTYNVWNEEW